MGTCSANTKEIKILMVGNSFSQSVLKYLPAIVKSEGKYKLTLAQMYIGGCTLERHIQELDKAQIDPGYKPYTTNYSRKRNCSLPMMINAEKWDIVTIQQGSTHSWDETKTQPYASQLISYIKANAPHAEIVIQQTWAYCNADLRIGGTAPAWGFDQAGMYQRLSKVYSSLAKEYKFRLIPTGYAVEQSRLKTNKDNLASQLGDVVGNGQDTIHLNNRGEYLQACVWYGFIFEENPENIKYKPRTICKADSVFLRSCAQKALVANTNPIIL